MSSKLLTTTLLALAVAVVTTGNARAVSDADNLGQWDKPTKIGPDKDCHGDNALAWGWALLGIQLSGNASAPREVLDYNMAFINMARTHDGAFVIQPGRNLHEKAYSMSPRSHPTAAMVLALGADKARLRIQGVNGKPQT